MKFEIEIERNNVTPAQFLSYVRRSVDAKGGEMLRGDLDLSYFKAGNDLNFDIDHRGANDDVYQMSGCIREKSISKPYRMQTFTSWKNGAKYNEICEFEYDDEKTGHGYYYLCDIDAEQGAEETESADAEETAETAQEEIMGAIRSAMIETGRMSAKCRLECIEVSRDGDWMRVGCYLYKTSRTETPYMYWNLCVYTPKNHIQWDTTTSYYL